MFSRLRRLMTPPIFPDEDKTRAARLLIIIINATIVLNTASLVLNLLPTGNPLGLQLLFLAVIFFVYAFQYGLLMFIHRGKVHMAGHVFCAALWGIVTFFAYDPNGVGILSPVVVLYAFPILSAGLILGARPALIYMVLSIGAVIGLYVFALTGTYPDHFELVSAHVALFDHLATFVFMGVLLALTTQSIRESLNRARTTEKIAAERLTQLQAESSERSRLEVALQDLLENSLQGYFIIQNNRVVFANPAGAKIFGYSRQEILALEDANVLIAPDDLPFMVQRREQGFDPPQVEIRGRCKDGTILWIETFSLATMYQGEPAVQAVVMDISARKEAEQRALEVAVEKERIELLRQFLSGISHDLKNPLATIDLNLFLAHRLADNPNLHHRLDVIQSQSTLLNRFVQDILALSRFDHLPVLELHPTDLNTLLQEIADQLRTSAEQKNILTELRLDTALPFVLANHDELYRALINLVENALNYTLEGGRVTIHTLLNSHEVIAEVKDTGTGIHPDDLPNIFNPFFRADRAKISEKGSGLGLAIVKRIVEMHNGTVEVESQLGVGSTFRVCLPVQNPI